METHTINFKDVSFIMTIPAGDLSSYHGGNVSQSIRDQKLWGPDETALMYAILKHNNGCVLDIGANTGYFSLLALAMKHKVISVEANPVHSIYIKDSLKQNGFSDISHHEVFVGDSDSYVEFDGWSGYIGLTEGHATTSIKCVRTDSICQEAIFTKIDVEGAEPQVLEGMRPALSRPDAFPYIMFEVTYIMKDVVDKLQVDMLNKLISDGYTLYEIQPNILLPITSVSEKIKIWEQEYFSIHKKANTKITTAGGNLLAVKKGYSIPFQKNSRGYVLK